MINGNPRKDFVGIKNLDLIQFKWLFNSAHKFYSYFPWSERCLEISVSTSSVELCWEIDMTKWSTSLQQTRQWLLSWLTHNLPTLCLPPGGCQMSPMVVTFDDTFFTSYDCLSPALTYYYVSCEVCLCLLYLWINRASVTCAAVADTVSCLHMAEIWFLMSQSRPQPLA